MISKFVPEYVLKTNDLEHVKNRMTGKTTVFSLRIIATAIEEANKWQTASFPSVRNMSNTLDDVRRIVDLLDLQFFQFKKSGREFSIRSCHIYTEDELKEKGII